jgi:vacuolar protein sorting-associated protein 13A/C
VKIIDNLQLTIKDIHIRYEDEISKRYSFGVTLEEFKLYTVNAKGESEYIDRNKPEYANEPLRKKLELSNLGIYWNEKSWNFPSVDYETHMRSTIAKRGQTTFSHNYLILGSMQANLLQR